MRKAIDKKTVQEWRTVLNQIHRRLLEVTHSGVRQLALMTARLSNEMLNAINEAPK